MLTPEDIKMIADLMDEKLKPVNDKFDSIESRLNKIEEDIEEIKENTEITRVVTNEIVEWIDYNFRDEYPFPVDKKEAI